MDHSFTEKYPILNQMQNWPNACEIRIILYVTSWYTVMQIEWFWWRFGGKGRYPEICLLGPLDWYRLTLIPAWMNNDINQTVWDEINYPFPNFNGAAIGNGWAISSHTYYVYYYLSMLGLKLQNSSRPVMHYCKCKPSIECSTCIWCYTFIVKISARCCWRVCMHTHTHSQQYLLNSSGNRSDNIIYTGKKPPTSRYKKNEMAVFWNLMLTLFVTTVHVP